MNKNTFCKSMRSWVPIAHCVQFSLPPWSAHHRQRQECKWMDDEAACRVMESDEMLMTLVYLGIDENILKVDHSEHGCTTVYILKGIELYTSNKYWIIGCVNYKLLKLFQADLPQTYICCGYTKIADEAGLQCILLFNVHSFHCFVSSWVWWDCWPNMKIWNRSVNNDILASFLILKMGF